MRRAEFLVRHGNAVLLQALCDPPRQHGKTLRHGGGAPLRQHLHADRGHLHRDEMVALAHVETTRIGDVTRIGEIDRVIGTDIAAAGGGLLQRKPALMAPGDIDEGAAIGAEQPFVGRKDHEVRVETRDVQCQHAAALRGIDEKDRALPPQR
jgi:hypothetical protein